MKTIGALVRGRTVYYLRPDQSVREAAAYMTDRRVGAVTVLARGRLVGVLSERDVMSRVVAQGLDPDCTTVGEVMTRDLVVAPADDALEDGLRMMTQAGCRHLPVIEGGRLLGMVSQRDLLAEDISVHDDEIRWLNAYIHLIPPAREGPA